MGPREHPIPNSSTSTGILIQGKGVELEICEKNRNVFCIFLYPQPQEQGLALSRGFWGGCMNGWVGGQHTQGHTSPKGYQYGAVSQPKARALGLGHQQRVLCA